MKSRLVWVAVLLGPTGCVSSGARDWGADATWRPSLAALHGAVVEAAKDPHVWVPLAGAALFQVNGWDRKVSNWARDNTPVFGSQRSAQAWSDHLRTATSVAYFTTVALTPGPDDTGEWMRDKAQGLAVGLAAIAVTGAATTALKDATGRTRPNGQGTNSFPSGHTSHAAVLAGLGRDNLDAIDMEPTTRLALDTGLDALSVGTAWARIEAGAHFPSDTLVSMALGSFVSRSFDRAFLGERSRRQLAWEVSPAQHGVELHVALRY
jgi:membrane-associated phospholipid phosphatase